MKIFYILAVVCFTVNMLAGVVIKRKADRRGMAIARQAAFRTIIRSDLFITIPSLLVILAANFYVNAGKAFFFISLPWAVLILALYSSIMFAFVIHPLRMAMYRIATTAAKEDSFDAEAYHAFSQQWIIWGTIEIAPLVGLLWYSVGT